MLPSCRPMDSARIARELSTAASILALGSRLAEIAACIAAVAVAVGEVAAAAATPATCCCC
jgi:hypothetical protein